jgi:hypothetical protein
MIYTILILSLVLIKVPVIGKYFRTLNTLIHECSHAFFTLLTSGKNYKIALNPDTSGVQFGAHRSRMGRMLVTFSGYTFTSFLSYILFVVYFHGNYQIIFYFFMFVVGFSLLFWVRNIYGIFWLVTFGSILVCLFLFAGKLLVQYSVLFFLSVLFFESLSSAYTIFRLSLFRKEESGDAYSLYQQTKISARFWGTLFLAIAIYFSFKTVMLFLG